jgi:predicted adenine nucleotide alpha hydrolase (AANH) superfamily ATPase
MKKKFQLEVPGGADKVLLHTCCAPCSSAIIECLMQHGVTPVIYYCNPNIYPLEEYIIRKDECTRYAQSLGLEIIDADYDHDAWRCRMGARMMRYIMNKKNIDSLESLRTQAIQNGVEFIACQMSMDVMGVKREELLDHVTIGGVATYMNRAEQANVNLFI